MKNEDKRSAVRKLLLEGSVVRIIFGVQYPGVVVPDPYERELRLALDFGLNGVGAPDDLEVGDDAISATLGFGGDKVWCSVPWAAVVGIIPYGEKAPQETTTWKPELLKGGLN